ncbi:helix-turn-helix transcriptional regulator [Desulfallas sp. Bu1-1]|uniref:helix-turn-helix domain-containing protein n=1 Tax=Desulfallas sp. Bu1-1 TaxID=2787620 RepID=UPI00189C9542|nr:helix-turn-helix transcriptional regulator [Desulfallas sp. Bu1-1]MBF7082837.1 helix-turn-helix transcriptional regulator [Desulfallas sp. Bu1-1]
MDSFSKRLRLLRENNKLTLEGLADVLGISKSLLWDLEQGRRRVHGELLLKIALYFDVSTDYLLGLADEKNSQAVNLTEKVKYELDPETVQILHKARELSPRGREQLRRVVEWVFEVDERERKTGRDK